MMKIIYILPLMLLNACSVPCSKNELVDIRNKIVSIEDPVKQDKLYVNFLKTLTCVKNMHIRDDRLYIVEFYVKNDNKLIPYSLKKVNIGKFFANPPDNIYEKISPYGEPYFEPFYIKYSIK